MLGCWVQIGVVSWGYGCGQYVAVDGVQRQIPGYHANVMQFSSWINSTIYNSENEGK